MTQQRHVLIVSPNFPPINAPDHQRVRMALPYFREFGWEPVVLAVAAEFSEGSRDETLLATLPEDVEIHHVRALPAQMTRTVGLGSLALRSLPFLRAKGKEILASRKFDLVFFSSTLFPVMSLGPVWRKRFGIPYLLDFQDPWLTDYYDNNDSEKPGGRIKYAFSRMLGKALEPRVVRQAAHIVVVSPAYPELFRERYPELNGNTFTVLPFAASERDFEIARNTKPQHGIFERGDGLIHWVYAGVVGPMMEKSIRAFFSALKSKLAHDEQLAARLRVHFIGTNYVAGSQQTIVEPLAAEYGLAGIVHETTCRLPFLTTLKLLLDADALLVFGSDDPAYTGSKIFPYVLARKPLLVVAHKQSSLGDIVRQCRAGVVVTFGQDDQMEKIADRITETWLNGPAPDPETDWQEFGQYSAREMTRKLCAVFEVAAPTPLVASVSQTSAEARNHL
jgi:hypothetical protein